MADDQGSSGSLAWLREDIREVRADIANLRRDLSAEIDSLNSKLTTLLTERRYEKRMLAVVGGGLGALFALVAQWAGEVYRRNG